MHVLITGHTGFKGAWLTLMLQAEGHSVSGIGLDPAAGALFETARVGELMTADLRQDIRDDVGTSEAIREAAPDVVFHMAAQPLVRESYRDPRATFETNVVGTLNVLEAVSATPSVKALVVITTDKVYRNVNQIAGYSEDDALGAADPYSSSKAMADILAQSWAKSFHGTPTAIARGGNVIGGGDNAQDRLLPDLMRAFSSGDTGWLRFPDAVRPWQHVLDCLDGYRAIASALVAGGGRGEWNIGPGAESFVTVGKVASTAATLWGAGARWEASTGNHVAEAGLLALDPAKAERELGWSNRLRFPDSLSWVIDWHKRVDEGKDPREVSKRQIVDYYGLRGTER